MSTERRPAHAEGAPDEATELTLWGRVWPSLLAVVVVGAVGAPAAVASYKHARDVVAYVGNVDMAPWLPLSVDGMLLAALVVIWVRRLRGDKIGVGPWLAFGFGMAVTIAANLAAVQLPAESASLYAMTGPHIPVRQVGFTDYAVALFPPLALAITLELVGMVANRTSPEKRHQLAGDHQAPTTRGDHQTTRPANHQPGGDHQTTHVVVGARPPATNHQAPPARDHQTTRALPASTTSQATTSPRQTTSPATTSPTRTPGTAPTGRPVLKAVPTRRPSWMTDDLLDRAVEAIKEGGPGYGRGQLMEDLGVKDWRAKDLIKYIDDNKLARRSA